MYEEIQHNLYIISTVVIIRQYMIPDAQRHLRTGIWAEEKSPYLKKIAKQSDSSYPALKQHSINNPSGVLGWLGLVPSTITVS